MPHVPKSLSAHRTRAVNRARVLWHLSAGATTRRELAERAQLSASAITSVVSELAGEGIVAEGDRTGERRVGRPTTRVSLVPHSRAVVGVHVGHRAVRGVLCDLAGDVMATRDIGLAAGEGPESAIAACIEATRGLMADAGGVPVLGAGIGAPGRADAEHRRTVVALKRGWRDVGFADAVESALGIPAIVDRGVNAMALAEYRFGRERGTDGLVFVYADAGLAAGLIVDGEQYKGSGHGVSGFGHLPVPGAAEPCACGGRGWLETVASRPRLDRGADRWIAENFPSAGVGAGLQGLCELVRSGRSDGGPVLARLMDALSVALVSVVNLLDPSVIIVGGYLEEEADVLLPRLVDAVRGRVLPLLSESLRIQTSTFGVECGPVGAAALALDAFFYTPISSG